MKYLCFGLATLIGATLACGPLGATPTPPPAAPIATQIASADSMVQVFVPAGDFQMGADAQDKNANTSEQPLHAIYLDDFYIDQTEVTNAMYSLCVTAGVCQPPARNEPCCIDRFQANYDNTKFPNNAVSDVSWADAATYCKWAGRRLPTEAEWEKAARGTDGRLYPWGNWEPDKSFVNFDHYFEGHPDSVDQFPDGASPYGALGLAGNVWEWVADWYGPDYYADSPDKNPTGPASGLERVYRGGSWTDKDVRVTIRGASQPQYAWDWIGFRCAASP